MNAADYAAVIARAVQTTLDGAGHADCPHAKHAAYYPAEGDQEALVVCPCGSIAFTAADLDTGSAPATPGTDLIAPPPNPVQSVLDAIDPTRIHTPAELEARILDCVARLEHGVAFEQECVLRAYETKQAYEFAEARALVAATGRSVDVRRAEALLACTAEHEAMVQAEMLLKAAKAAMHNIRAALSGHQSVLKSIQTTYSVPTNPR